MAIKCGFVLVIEFSIPILVGCKKKKKKDIPRVGSTESENRSYREISETA
jgi:hypothetical protein